MQGKMKVAVMNGIGQMGYTERDIPTPKDDEVLVKLEYVGIIAGGWDKNLQEDGSIVVELQAITGATNEMGFNRLSAR